MLFTPICVYSYTNQLAGISAISGLRRLANTALMPSLNNACMVVRSSAAMTFSAVGASGAKWLPISTRPSREGLRAGELPADAADDSARRVSQALA